jgi:hypothetical protein
MEPKKTFWPALPAGRLRYAVSGNQSQQGCVSVVFSLACEVWKMRHRRHPKRPHHCVDIRDCLIQAKRHDLSQPLPDRLRRILMALDQQGDIVGGNTPPKTEQIGAKNEEISTRGRGIV